MRYDSVVFKTVLMVPFLAGYIEKILQEMVRKGYAFQKAEDNYHWILKLIFYKSQPRDAFFYVFISSYRTTYPSDAIDAHIILTAFCSNIYANGPHLFIAQVNENWREKVAEYKFKRTGILLKRYIILLLITISVDVCVFVGLFVFDGLDYWDTTKPTATAVILALLFIIITVYFIVAVCYMLHEKRVDHRLTIKSQ